MLDWEAIHHLRDEYSDLARAADAAILTLVDAEDHLDDLRVQLRKKKREIIEALSFTPVIDARRAVRSRKRKRRRDRDDDDDDDEDDGLDF